MSVPDVNVRRLVWEMEKTFGVGSAIKDTSESTAYLQGEKIKGTFPTLRTCRQPSGGDATDPEHSTGDSQSGKPSC